MTLTPISQIPDSVLASLKGIFFDIDDTFSYEGKIIPEAFQALDDAHTAGLLTIPITGRPAGWCDHIARMWPVDGVVGENGGLYFRMADGKMVKRYIYDAETRRHNRLRLERIKSQVLADIPGAGVSSDQFYREFDLAIDYREDVPELSKAEVNRIVEIFKAHGATVKVSSIHVNGWFGDYDKLSMCRLFLKECFNIELDKAQDSFIFAGDSLNDEPMFAYFKHSVGVANIRRFDKRLDFPPKYITESEGGYGFVELIRRILRSRL